jgi:putative transposase
MIRKDEKLSMRRQCELLEINRSSVYYQPAEESDENLYIMRMLDKRHLDHPTHGVLEMQDFLFARVGCQRETDPSFAPSDGNHGPLS